MLIFGYVKLLKKIATLGYKNNDMRVYLHLLISANYTAGKINGVDVTAGQSITSYGAIADRLGLTDKAVRVAVQHLVDGGKIKIDGVKNKYTICTVTDYRLIIMYITIPNYTATYRRTIGTVMMSPQNYTIMYCYITVWAAANIDLLTYS